MSMDPKKGLDSDQFFFIEFSQNRIRPELKLLISESGGWGDQGGDEEAAGGGGGQWGQDRGGRRRYSQVANFSIFRVRIL